MRAKLGPAGAVTAGAHILARIFYPMIKTRTAFDPSKLGYPALTRQRKERPLRKQAAQLGFTLQPAAAGAVACDHDVRFHVAIATSRRTS